MLNIQTKQHSQKGRQTVRQNVIQYKQIKQQTEKQTKC